MVPQRKFVYNAFISHRCKGKGWQASERLIRFLQQFETPHTLRKANPGLSRNLSPFFYSEDDLTAMSLYDEMPVMLADTRLLIIVCTPDYAVPSVDSGICYADVAAASFLGYEVSPKLPHGIPAEQMQHYAEVADKERERQILAILYPQADSDSACRECRSPFLRQLDCDVLDTSQCSEIDIFLTIAARILGVEECELRLHWRQREKRRRRRRRVCGAVLLFCLLGLILWGYSYYLPHSACYGNYTERNNIPVGLCPLTQEQCRHAQRHFRITEQYHRVVKLECLNSVDGLCTPPQGAESAARFALCRIEYNASDGKVSRYLCYNPQGKLLHERLYNGNTVTFRTPQQAQGEKETKPARGAYPARSDGQTPLARGRVEGIQREFDDRGFVTQERFTNLYGQPVQNELDVWGYRYDRDEDGYIFRRTALNKDGKPMPDRQGVTSYLYHYTISRQLSAVICCDEERYLVPGPNGYAIEAYTVDKQGNRIEESYKDVEDRPCLHRRGYAHIQRSFDSQGRLTAEEYRDPEGRAVLCPEGYARREWRYDESGRPVEECYSGTGGESCTIREGYAQVKRSYNAAGYLSSERYYNRSGKACVRDKGYACVKYEYDAEGNVIAESYEDTENRPCMSKEHYAVKRWKTDDFGNRTSESYFNTEGEPCLCRDGYVHMERAYDAFGRITKESYFGHDNSPRLSKQQYAGKELKYDDEHHTVISTFSGIDGAHCADADGYRNVSATLDALGRTVTETSYLIAQGTPRISFLSYRQDDRKAHLNYNDSGRICSVSYTHLNDEPYTYQQSYHRIEWTYDDAGRKVSERYYDREGEPYVLEQGYACVEWTYDAEGRRRTERYADGNGEPCRRTEGYAGKRMDYDEQGRLTSVTYLDEHGQPCLTAAGYARKICEYNHLRQKVGERYYGTDGLPCLHRMGYASKGWEYDRQGALVAQKHFDRNGKPCHRRDGFHCVRWGYDNFGRVVTQEFSDTELKPCLYKNRYSLMKWSYSPYKHPLIPEYYLPNGKIAWVDLTSKKVAPMLPADDEQE